MISYLVKHNGKETWKAKERGFGKLGGKKEEFIQYKLEIDSYRDKLCMVEETENVNKQGRSKSSSANNNEDDSSSEEEEEEEDKENNSASGQEEETRVQYDWNLRTWDEAAVKYINSLNEILNKGKKRGLPDLQTEKENANNNGKRRFSSSAEGKGDIRSKYRQSLGKTHDPPAPKNNQTDNVNV